MRPTLELTASPSLRLAPASPHQYSQILAAVTESHQSEVRRALPWLEWDAPLESQIMEYLRDVERMGRGGLSHHWAVIEEDELVGLIALDHTPHLVVGHWNLGYWIRSDCHGRRLASNSIDVVLGWIGRSSGSPTGVEIRVDPDNIAGIATAKSVAQRWNGLRFEEGDVDVDVDGEFVTHLCWLIPRLPLEVK